MFGETAHRRQQQNESGPEVARAVLASGTGTASGRSPSAARSCSRGAGPAELSEPTAERRGAHRLTTEHRMSQNRIAPASVQRRSAPPGRLLRKDLRRGMIGCLAASSAHNELEALQAQERGNPAPDQNCTDTANVRSFCTGRCAGLSLPPAIFRKEARHPHGAECGAPRNQ